MKINGKIDKQIVEGKGAKYFNDSATNNNNHYNTIHNILYFNNRI